MRYIARTVNLNQMLVSDELPGSLFEGEVLGHTFAILAKKDNELQTLTGTITATFDLDTYSATIPLNGSIVNGAAVVTLSSGCYVPGHFTLTVYCTSNGDTTALWQGKGRIKVAGSGAAYDPDDLIPNLQQLTAAIAEMEAATDAANAAAESALGNFAPAFAQAAPKDPGTFVTYSDGKMYYLSDGHAAGDAWADTAKTVTNVGAELTHLKSALITKVAKEAINLVDTSKSVVGTINYDGNIISSNTGYKTTDYIFCKKGVTYVFTPAARFALFFYTDKRVAVDSYMGDYTSDYTFTPSADRYVRISYAASAESSVALKSYLSTAAEKVEEGISLSNYQIEQVSGAIQSATSDYVTATDVASQIESATGDFATESYVGETIAEYIQTVTSANLYDNTQTLENGFIQSDGTLNTSGAWDGYRTTGYISLPAGTYTVTRYPVVSMRCAILVFDAAKNIVSYSYNGSTGDYNTVTLAADGYIRFSAANAYMTGDYMMLLAGSYSEPTAYIAYSRETILNKDIIVPYSGNILLGKKWWACGDSFTAWTTEQFDPAEYPNITSVDSRFHYKTYPFWIGARNGMTVHNFAVSGQTMAYPTERYDGTPSGFQNAFSNGKYQTIPADVDYITLYFGINDSHHRPGSQGGDGESNEGVITIGTIDDTATNTFYGAWNTVLEYLITNHPWAKIGIIITNGAETDEYAQAEIAVAKKWGVPYIDLNGDYKLPLMLRVNGKPDVCEEAIAIRKAQQWADPAQGNGHPNANAHKFESTFIEAWLRSI